jgi:hypothetical protein
MAEPMAEPLGVEIVDHIYSLTVQRLHMYVLCE